MAVMLEPKESGPVGPAWELADRHDSDGLAHVQLRETSSTAQPLSSASCTLGTRMSDVPILCWGRCCGVVDTVVVLWTNGQGEDARI